jgi:hypothetical protein
VRQDDLEACQAHVGGDAGTPRTATVAEVRLARSAALTPTPRWPGPAGLGRRSAVRAGDQGCAAGAERAHLIAQRGEHAGERPVHGPLGALVFTAAIPVQREQVVGDP